MEKVLRSGTIAFILLIPSFLSLIIYDPITVTAGETRTPVFLGIDKNLNRYYNDTRMNITIRTSIPFNESHEYSFYYNYTTRGIAGIGDGEWFEIEEPLKNKDTTDIMADCIFKTGDQNFIRFSAINSSDEMFISKTYNIMIDDRGPRISLHSPSEQKWLIEPSSEFTFVIEDLHSGPDPISIQYRIMKNGSGAWSDWMPCSDWEEARHSIVVKIRADLNRGDDNLIEIMGCDNLGNPIKSNRIFRFKVNTIPVINITSPRDGDTLWDDTEIVFDASSSYDLDGDLLNYKWTYSMGDEFNVLGEVSRYITRLEPGDYTITLTIKDRIDNVVQESFTVRVRSRYWDRRFPEFDNTTDKDHDGIPDNWELKYWLNRWLNDSAEDPDGDGFTNLQEFQNDTNPWDPNEHPPIIIKEAPPPKFMTDGWFEQYWTVLMIVSLLLILVVLTIVLFIKKYRKRSRK